MSDKKDFLALAQMLATPPSPTTVAEPAPAVERTIWKSGIELTLCASNKGDVSVVPPKIAEDVTTHDLFLISQSTEGYDSQFREGTVFFADVTRDRFVTRIVPKQLSETALDGVTIVHNMMKASCELTYIGPMKNSGFSQPPHCAEDTKTNEMYLLDRDTAGFDPATIKEGARILADITTGYYVTKMRLPQNTPGN